MKTTKLEGAPLNFSGEITPKGSKLVFKAINTDGSTFDIEQVKGTKIISVFPDISTSVCDDQTVKISQLADKHKNVTFISISLDAPEMQKEWCAAKGIDNIIIVSDKEHGEFGNKTNLLINEIQKLGRGLIVLDENNTIVEISINEELTVQPDWEKIEKYL